ncbi:hypothetical protein Cgig2_006818 [Carnegiea gigantea]|uniref:Reverse transcriptase n=1 Tax=Carnegiea gigantea TaxID=171969 RepID=A0A9Q1JQJ7_9CARY|nr:hypothetical protein Cgig2_006818 [Carnegiea gigantea]
MNIDEGRVVVPGKDVFKRNSMTTTRAWSLRRRDVLGQIRKCHKQEEILWWQRLWSEYLKHGDTNIRWFHTRASMTKARNLINQQKDDKGCLVQLFFFKVISLMPPSMLGLKVCDLIDFDNMCWKDAMIRELLAPCVAKVITGIPLCASTLGDKLVWHYNADGFFSLGLPTADRNLEWLSSRAIFFVRSYCDVQIKKDIPIAMMWKPPTFGTVKFNFDGGRVGENGWGWG